MEEEIDSMLILGHRGMSESMLVEFNRIQGDPTGCTYHTLEAHNYHITRYRTCLYCLLGSEPVHKSILLEKQGLKE